MANLGVGGPQKGLVARCDQLLEADRNVPDRFGRLQIVDPSGHVEDEAIDLHKSTNEPIYAQPKHAYEGTAFKQ